MNISELTIDKLIKTTGTLRKIVNSVPIHARGEDAKAPLKEGYGREVDVVGEKYIISVLEKVSQSMGDTPIRLIVDATKGDVFTIGDDSKPGIFGYADVVDGTIKVAGLGNEPGIFRLGNDGLWGSGYAFTDITDKELSDITVSDFKYGYLVDGNPSMFHHAPTNAFTKGNGTYEFSERNLPRSIFASVSEEVGIAQQRSLYTSTQENLGQGAVLFDKFQGFDRNSAKPGTEELIAHIDRTISNRNEGGAFDVWRSYGTMGELLRGMFWYGNGLEPQGVAAIRINDHLGNAIPPYSVFTNAGGIITDFDGNDLGDMKLTEGRPNSVYAANPIILEKVLDLVNS